MSTITLALLIVAAVLAIVEIVKSRAQDIDAWAILAVTAALLLPRLT